MNQLKTTHAQVAWKEDGDTIQIQISLPGSNPLAGFLKSNPFPTFLKESDELPKKGASIASHCGIDGLFVRNGIRFDKVMHRDILFLEAQGAYTLIHTLSRVHTISRNLTRCSRDLQYPFMRVHRSYTINLENIDSFTDANVFYQDKRIPVSEPYRKELLAYFNKI